MKISGTLHSPFLAAFSLACLLPAITAQQHARAQTHPPVPKQSTPTQKPKSALVAEPSVKLIATLRDARITESSGLAISRANSNLFWTHNDSGDGPYLFALDRTGKTVSRVTISGATNVDWEDMASGPGEDARPALYVADFGDNNHNRDNLVIYRIPEPVLDPKHPQSEIKSELPDKFFFQVPRWLTRCGNPADTSQDRGNGCRHQRRQRHKQCVRFSASLNSGE